jgi:ArsR family transcriptional regulator, lead/cadmium/zinc/bismuth-responsive transcriptional repressor
MATKALASQLPIGVTPPEEGCSVRVIHVEHVTEIQRHLLQGTDALNIANLFSVLSDPTRVQVMHALLCAPTGELCVCDLASGLGRDDSTISHQLRVLRQQKIVSMRKAGRVVYYRLVDEHMRQLLRMSIDHVREQQVWGV